jgi:outer membrane receptor protein involved in Fe transport
VNYKGEYHFSDSFNEKSSEYSILNFSIGKKFKNFNLTFWGNNILNEKYATRGFYFGLIPPDYPDQLFKSYGDPRQLGIKIDYIFKQG